MLTMVASRMTTKSAMASSASALHRHGSGMAKGVGGSVVRMALSPSVSTGSNCWNGVGGLSVLKAADLSGLSIPLAVIGL